MKNIVILFLFGLLAFSFVGESALFSFTNKAKIEVNNDTDLEGKELKEKKSKAEYIDLGSTELFNPNFPLIKPTVRYTSNLLSSPFEVDIRPPQV